MALVVEDGSLVANANTYVDAAGARAYATDRGVTLPAEDGAVTALLIQSMDYLEAQRARYKGNKVSSTQSLQWPRECVYIDDSVDVFSPTSIPKELIAAECQCAMDIFAGRNPLASTGGQTVKREKVDVIETEYMTATDMGSVGMSTTFPAVDALLAPLVRNAGLFSTVRV